MGELVFPSELKKALDEITRTYKNPSYLQTDPIIFPHRYKNSVDIEIISLLSCLYAYGNVKSIKNFLESIFKLLGPNPYECFLEKQESLERKFSQINYYRFQTNNDNRNILLTLSSIIKKHDKNGRPGPIFESYFLEGLECFEPQKSISSFQAKLNQQLLQESKTNKLTRGLRFLIGDPKSQSAKKRICLFLRWMVRDQFPDFGIYKLISPRGLAFPLDVHVQRLIKILGISDRKNFGIKEGILVRDFFQKMNPDDPLLYDFYLTRVGMIQKCRGIKIDSICGGCGLRSVCLIGSATGN